MSGIAFIEKMGKVKKQRRGKRYLWEIIKNAN